MKIEHDLQSSIRSPADCLIQNIKLTLNIWIVVKKGECPISNRYADVVESHIRNLLEIALGDPRIPMRRESVESFVFAQSRAHRVLVFDLLVVRPIAEHRRSNPGFQDEPPTEVHTANLVVGVIKGKVLPLIENRSCIGNSCQSCKSVEGRLHCDECYQVDFFGL